MTSNSFALFIWIVVLLIAVVILGLMNIQNTRNAKRERLEEEELEEKQNRRIFQHYIPLFKAALIDATTLGEVYTIHLQMWGAGIRPSSIGPDKYGMYRTEDILTMTPKEIYLGAICGLTTHTATYWENNRESDPAAYSQVLCQYKSHLLSNLEAYRARQVISQD